MSNFEAKVVENIPANRLVALGGVNREGNMEEGWETVYLIPSQLGWIPDMVTTNELEEGSFVDVSIKDSPIWKVEASEDLPAGTLVQCDVDGRVKHYVPADGNHVGYTTHSVVAGEVVSFVRKYGTMPQTQTDAMTFQKAEGDFDNLTKDELKGKLDKKGIEYTANATKKELIELLGADA